LEGALAVVRKTSAPVINHPATVMSTGREEVAKRLGTINGVIAAKTVTWSRERLLRPDAGMGLKQEGLSFPLLLRSPGFHGGEHFVRVETAEGLATALDTLPGEAVLVMEYLDARGTDGLSRKYRVMMIDGRLYPLHLAISNDWKIHYFSADMAESETNRAEDERFLNDMEGVLGTTAMAALHEVQLRLGLDYAGIDFGLNASGEMLLFESNATMAVVIPEKDAKWNYRRPAVEQIYKAVWTMLADRARSKTALCNSDVTETRPSAA